MTPAAQRIASRVCSPEGASRLHALELLLRNVVLSEALAVAEPSEEHLRHLSMAQCALATATTDLADWLARP